MRFRLLQHCVSFTGVLTLAAACIHAQDYPAHAIRLVVPYVTGGSNDIVARILAPRMGESMNQQIIVDNRGGGASIIGTDIVAKAAPDGYTALLTNIALAANPSLFKKLPYDADRDFIPVSLISTMPTVLVVTPSISARDVKQLIALAKSKPGGLSYASAGNGSVNHLTMEVFRSMAGLNLVHVPYKGAAPALTDLMSGQVALMFATVTASQQYIKAGRMIALAMSSGKRSSALPDVPTMAEAGLPGFDVLEWQLLLVPARTPAAIVERLNTELVKALRNPEARERLTGLGADPVGSLPQEAVAFFRSELARWVKVAKEANIQAVD